MNSRSDRFSQKIIGTPPSGIRKFFELIQGRDDIISLGVGEPDFSTPWIMREEAFYHLEKGHTSYLQLGLAGITSGNRTISPTI